MIRHEISHEEQKHYNITRLPWDSCFMQSSGQNESEYQENTKFSIPTPQHYQTERN